MIKTYFRNKLLCSLLIAAAVPFAGTAQTIAEKKSGFSEESQEMTPELHRQLTDINLQLKNSQEELRRLYSRVNQLFEEYADDESYHYLLDRINEIRANNLNLENNWRELSVRVGQTESYALWHQPETTLGQLVMDYGSQDYVYLLTPEIASLPVSVGSNLLIPRASWGDMLDVILTQNGVGYKQLNPYLRQLFFLTDDNSNIRLITNIRRDLDLFSPETRVSFVLTPEPAEVRRTWLFLDKFVNPNSTVLQMVGRDILIIGPVGEMQDLLKLYDFVASNTGDKEYKVFPVTRVDVDEMARILSAIFDQSQGSQPIKLTESRLGFGPPGFGPGGPKGLGPMGPGGPQGQAPRFKPAPPSMPMANASENSDVNGLRIIPLGSIARALFLVGTKEELRKAEQIIRQVESQVGEAREKVIYWYTAKHSDPEELAEVLNKIYLLMVKTGVGFQNFGPGGPPPGFGPLNAPTADAIADQIIEREIEMLPSELYQTSYYQQGNYIVNPSPIEPRATRTPTTNTNRDNFLVDPKTGSIAMVVEADILPKIKDLIKKLDVAKKMVLIEALLFERRISKQNNFGLNLLRIGECAKQTAATCLSFSDPIEGILSFVTSGKKTCGLPAYDVAYQFLMTQDDIQINASPSVVAINQTPATIAIVEEISINTGIFNVETARGNTLEKAFTRTQYGITISITPTIHITSDEFEDSDEPNYVTLETDITFDTIQGGLQSDRPDVTRRHITNDVRIPDGQTVILGGLRRKNTDDFKEGVPFLGDVPGIGKLFSMRKLQDNEVEMFIFLTPTIISDPLDDFERIKCEEMRRRPGDVPEFMCRLVAARDLEKNRVMAGSLRILFGPDPERCRSPSYWMPTTCGHRGWTDDCPMFRGLPCSGEFYGR